MSADSSAGESCVDPSLAAAIADGKVERSVRERALTHADRCEDCRQLLAALTLAAADDADAGDPGLAVPEPMRYVLAGELGRGGLGRVVKARDRRLGRTVAVKLLAADAPGAKARFIREVRITARLQHPAIVPIYDAGEDGAGEPFYAMRMVAGDTLADAIKAAETFEQRLALVPQVLTACEAVAHAHGRGIVHRDLKPANVLVAELGETVVIDWGLAKDLLGGAAEQAVGGRAAGARADTHETVSARAVAHADTAIAQNAESVAAGDLGDRLEQEIDRDHDPDPDHDLDEDLTRAGTVMGTPAYMAPEQARGEPADPRADVWALGAILYTVMSGRAPFTGDSATTVIKRVAAADPAPIETLAPDTPAELAAIVEKAMAPRSGDRYPTARELAADLRRFTTGQLVGAARYSSWELVRRWLRRHRAAVTVATVLTLAMIIGGAFSVQRIVAERAEAQARRAEAEARSAELVLSNARGALDLDPTKTLAWLKQYPENGRDWQQASAIAADAVARGVAKHVLSLGKEAISLAFSPDGAELVASTLTELVWIDVSDGTIVRREALPSTRHLLFARNTLVAATTDGRVVMFPEREGRREFKEHEGDIWQVRLSDDAGSFCTAGDDGDVRLWNVDALTSLLAAKHDGGARDCAFAPDGVLWSVGADSMLRRTPQGSPSDDVGELDVDIVMMAFVDDGSLRLLTDSGHSKRWIADDAVNQLIPIAAAPSADQRVVRYEEGFVGFVRGEDSARDSIGRELRHRSPVTELAIGAGPFSYVSGTGDGAVYLWRRGAGPLILRGHRASIGAVALSDDGRLLASVGDDSELRLWDVPEEQTVRVRHARGRVNEFGFTAQYIYAATFPFAVYRWPAATEDGEVVASFENQPYALAEHAGTGRIAAATFGGSVVVFEHDQELARFSYGAGISDIAFTPGGDKVVTAGDDNSLRVWRAADGEEVSRTEVPAEPAQLAWSDDGRLLVSSGAESVLRVWRFTEESTFEPVAVLTGMRARGTDPMFLPGDRGVVAGSFDGSVRHWTLDAVDAPATLMVHEGPARTIALDREDQLVASGGADGVVRVSSLREPRTVYELRGHGAAIRHLAFSPAKATLASGAMDGELRVWSLPDGASALLRGHAKAVMRVAFRVSDDTLFTSSDDGTLREWRGVDDLAPASADLSAWLSRATQAMLSQTGEFLAGDP